MLKPTHARQVGPLDPSGEEGLTLEATRLGISVDELRTMLTLSEVELDEAASFAKRVRGGTEELTSLKR